MNEYDITITATSVKEFTVFADSYDEAHELAEDIFFNSDLVDFTDNDIVGIDVEVDSTNEETEDDGFEELMEYFFSASKEEKRTFVKKLIGLLDE